MINSKGAMPQEEDALARTLPTLTNSIPWEAEADAHASLYLFYVCMYIFSYQHSALPQEWAYWIFCTFHS